MKNFKALIVILVLLVGCESAKKEYSFQVINPYHLNRIDEPVIINRQYLPGFEENQDKYPVIANSNKELFPFQLDDLDGDGEWDELFLLVDTKQKDTLVFHIDYKKEVPNLSFEKRANVRFGQKNSPFTEIDTVSRLPEGDTKITSQYFQMEGPAWENDIVGFRNYYDSRNGMDIFGKQTSDMVLDSAGINGQNYHALDNWGMDILKVGQSLGAGGIALKQNDSIYRWSPSGKGTYRLISDGPLRAILELGYEGWQVANGSVDLTHRISIWGGSNVYKSEIFLNENQDDLTLVTGIVNLHSDSLLFSDLKEDVILATHDVQAENQAYLGMAIFLNKTDYLTHYKAPNEGLGVISTYVTELKLTKKKPVLFYFYAGWQNQNQDFKNEKSYMPTLIMASDLLNYPLLINTIP